MDLNELLERIAKIPQASASELAEIEASIIAAYESLRADDDRSDETIEGLAQLADALDAVRSRSQELATQLEELDVRVVGESAQAQDEPDAEDEPEDAPIAASAGPTPLHRIARSRPAAFAPRQTGATGPVIRTYDETGTFRDLGEVASIETKHLNDAMSAPDGRVEHRVATITASRARQLRNGDDATEALLAAGAEFRALLASGGPDALTAAGGVCGPVAPYYDQAVVAGAERPIAAGLPGVGGDRGGIRFVPPPALSSILVDQSGGAVGLQTNAEDLSGTQKTVQNVGCATEQEVKVDAVWSALGFGNAGARFFPERVKAYQDNALAQHARVAEQRLLSLIDTASTGTVHTAKVIGASRDLLGAVTRTVSRFRSYHRMPRAAQLSAIFPVWALDVFRADLINAWSGSLENMNVTDAMIEGWLRNAGVNPIWSPDRQVFGAQGIGGALDFADAITWNLFHAGAFVHIDGGTLDLGVVRDSTLNADNRFQLFTESWESVAFVGVEALKLSSDICTSGLVASTVDTSGKCSGAAFGS